METRYTCESCLIPGEKGIVSKKGPFFQMASQFAKNYLFLILWADEYVCIPPYRVLRSSLNSFLFFHILEGELHFNYRGKQFTARPGDIVLLDCHLTNHYWAEKRVRFRYFHFNGNISQEYCDLLYEQKGALFRNVSAAAVMSDHIQNELMNARPDEHRLSQMICSLLGMLASCGAKHLSQPVSKALEFMQEHLREPVSVDDIASYVALSKFHFTRLFKEEIGFSPHEYLLNIRMQRARELLSNTSQTVDSIAFQCGYTNTSNFIRAFKKNTEVTPSLFRKFFHPTGFRTLE